MALLVAFAGNGAFADSLKEGKGTFRFKNGDGPEIRVFYYKAKDLPDNSPIMFVMHGVNRDADRYLAEWRRLAREYGFLLICPEFSENAFPGARGYNLGNVFDTDGNMNPEELWSYSYIEGIFDDVKKRTGYRNRGYYMYGHSAGSQFVHRMIFFQPQARFIKAVSANAGWYTLPLPDIDFPYGLNNTPVSRRDLMRALNQPLVVLLGTKDNDPNHRHLRRAPEAMRQGDHRFERGHTFYFMGEKQARHLSVNFGWEIKHVPGVAHHNRYMAAAAVEELFGNK
ncbi:MAG: hypothetical protein JJU20_00985 [Opitutales bacterium]|nr:hypothetical protein [Opitutales bacterium]